MFLIVVVMFVIIVMLVIDIEILVIVAVTKMTSISKKMIEICFVINEDDRL